MRDFAVFILTNGRPDKVLTYETLKRHGYTGPIYLIVDDLDATRSQYLEKYGDIVKVFDKKKIAASFDNADNFNDMRAIVFARNASFQIAKELGITYFMQLDDDYVDFLFKYDEKLDFISRKAITDLDELFESLLKFYKSAPFHSIAIAQSGDFLGGPSSPDHKYIKLKRKCMNSFLCSIDRTFQFVGRVNEDVNTYTCSASRGALFGTFTQVCLTQLQTQSNPGGMTELYIDSGTYIKSFYTVMYHPSAVKIRPMKSSGARLHHSISWKHTVPKILRESVKKIEVS